MGLWSLSVLKYKVETLRLEEDCVDNSRNDEIRARVRCRSAVFNIRLRGRYAYRSGSIAMTECERVCAAGLVESREALGVVAVSPEGASVCNAESVYSLSGAL